MVANPSDIVYTPRTFARSFLRVLTKDMRVVPLRYNKAQRHYLDNRTPRDIIIKARQLGFSTMLQAELFRYATTRTARLTTIGKDDQNTTDLRVIFDRYWQNIPEAMRPSRSIANATEFRFPDFDSRAVIAKAGNVTSGRGGTNFAIHLSEIAFYRDASEIIKGVTQAGNPKWIVCETTPNGEQGWVYETVMHALSNPNDTAWRIHFYAWWWDDAYCVDGVTWDTLGDLSDEEYSLVDRHKLTAPQIAWRRAKIKEIGTHAFKQEYPEDIVTCFQTSAGGVFPPFDHLLLSPVAPYEGDFIAGLDWGREDDYTSLSIFDKQTGDEVFLKRWRDKHEGVQGSVKMSYIEIRKEVRRVLKEWGVKALFAEQNAMVANIEQMAHEIKDEGMTCELIPFNMTNRRKALVVDWLRQSIEASDVGLLDDPIGNIELRAYQESRTATGLPYYSHPKGGHDDTVDARLIAYFGLRQW